ncbi:potassium channel subfamily K member 16-like [Acanthaster planci]|uniref:Potassium channel subfamily K member 16-like n=1 Tax=Acanthaster planci TaxID=133434 RepID=A0A8B7ZG01_ACAPL|nr:potassium channel subfamily K member 16-like [Acanthaster planci]
MKPLPRRLIKTIILSVCFYGYLMLGALTFQATEAEPHRNLLKKSRRQLLRALQNFTDANQGCGVAMDRVRALLQAANNAWERDAFLVDPSNGVQPVWNLVDSMAFSLAVVTTIGYGDLVPRTTGGQVFCTLYAAAGVPLCYYMLMVVGKTFRTAWVTLFNCFANLKHRVGRRILYLIMPLTSLWIFLAVIPSLTLMQTEGWPYLTAQYYSFVTLSTIGFGDEQPRRTSPYTGYAYSIKVIFIVYILLGLSIISITFSGVSMALSEFREKTKRKRKCALHREQIEDHVAVTNDPSVTPLSYRQRVPIQSAVTSEL